MVKSPVSEQCVCVTQIFDYFSKAAFSQHHDEIKIRKLHTILVAVGVIFGDVVG